MFLYSKRIKKLELDNWVLCSGSWRECGRCRKLYRGTFVHIIVSQRFRDISTSMGSIVISMSVYAVTSTLAPLIAVCYRSQTVPKHDLGHFGPSEPDGCVWHAKYDSLLVTLKTVIEWQAYTWRAIQPVCENTTASTKPEVHIVSQRFRDISISMQEPTKYCEVL